MTLRSFYPPKPAHPPLSRLQQRILSFIQQYRMASPERVSPTYEEIVDGLKMKSKSLVHREVRALADHGAIQLFPRHKRGIIPAQTHAITVDFPDGVWAELLLFAGRANTSPDTLIIEAVRDALPLLRSRLARPGDRF